MDYILTFLLGVITPYLIKQYRIYRNKPARKSYPSVDPTSITFKNIKDENIIGTYNTGSAGT